MLRRIGRNRYENLDKRKYHIGDIVIDEDGTLGVVCIKFADGDLLAFENDAAHPGPIVIGHWPERKILGMED